jgi:hypothetical protein
LVLFKSKDKKNPIVSLCPSLDCSVLIAVPFMDLSSFLVHVPAIICLYGQSVSHALSSHHLKELGPQSSRLTIVYSKESSTSPGGKSVAI